MYCVMYLKGGLGVDFNVWIQRKKTKGSHCLEGSMQLCDSEKFFFSLLATGFEEFRGQTYNTREDEKEIARQVVLHVFPSG